MWYNWNKHKKVVYSWKFFNVISNHTTYQVYTLLKNDKINTFAFLCTTNNDKGLKR